MHTDMQDKGAATVVLCWRSVQMDVYFLFQNKLLAVRLLSEAILVSFCTKQFQLKHRTPSTVNCGGPES